MVTKKCSICQGEIADKTLKTHSFIIQECSICGYGLIKPIPSETELEDLYNSQKYYDENEMSFSGLDISDIERKTTYYGNLYMKYLKPYIPLMTRFWRLDVEQGLV